MDKLKISSKVLRGEDGYKTFSIRIKHKTVEALDRLADASGRSRNEIIGLLLDFGVEHCEIENQE